VDMETKVNDKGAETQEVKLDIAPLSKKSDKPKSEEVVTD
jgi:hypothetical protein